MPKEDVRYMWLFVFFDLPVGSKAERRNAAKFRLLWCSIQLSYGRM